MCTIKNKLIVIIEKQRQSIPKCNLKNFDSVTKSYVEEIEKRPSEFNKLTAELTNKINGFKAVKKDAIPPLLCQRENETNSDYINRCYKTGGYH